MKVAFLPSFLLLTIALANGQTFTIKEIGVFKPQEKKVVLFTNEKQKKLILFKTNLNVNTDGVPISYHPQDLNGQTMAINTILNGVAIYRLRDNIRISNPKRPNNFSKIERGAMASEAIDVFRRWRDANYGTFPVGYKIVWQNVLANDGDNHPCVFTEGKYKGYYGSLTALKNGTADKGECLCKDQVDPFEVPSIVLAGGKNIVTANGAKIGDLALAYHSKTKNLVYAVIGDSGPAENLGEGSVNLNMKLKGESSLPTNKRETYKLSITSSDVLVCIIPGSSKFRESKPYSQQNLQSRALEWFTQQGIEGEINIRELFESTLVNF